MTTYFDSLKTQARQLAEHEEDFVEELAKLEDSVIHTVSLATGDREFPDDMRETIQGLVALWRIHTPVVANARAIDYAKALRSSQLFDRLHSAFHELASRNIKTRFGRLSDSPEDIVRQRDARDQETP